MAVGQEAKQPGPSVELQSGQTDLLKKAHELELKESQKNKTNPEQISALGELLHDVYVPGRPKEIDYTNRRDLVRIFNEIAKDIFGSSSNVAVEEYGSFVMDIFNSKSDLDLSVNFASSSAGLGRGVIIERLRRLGKRFRAMQMMGHLSSFQPIYGAKIPILKLVDSGTGIECDISIENRDGIAKSHIVRLISSIDYRFQMLSFLMKAWAKAHNINSAVQNTLNSLSIISLVAFHLQTRHPPILPPFSEIMKGGTDLIAVEIEVDYFENYGKENKESVAELFVSLLNKLASVEKLWIRGLCASTYEGCWILKDFGRKFGCVKVEDFTDRTQNISRAVRTKDLDKIYNRINLSIESISSFMEGKIGIPKLRELLFGATLPPAAVSETSVSVAPVKSLERGFAETLRKRAAGPPMEPKPKKKNRAAAPPVEPKLPKPKRNKKPFVPPVESRPEGSGGNPPVNWGGMPVGADWGRELALNLGITPGALAAANRIVSLGGIPAVGGGAQPSNVWRPTAAESFAGAPRVGPLSGNWGRLPAEGLYGTHGIGQQPRFMPPPSGNWGRPPTEGFYGGPTAAAWGTPPSQNWGRAPTGGSYATHGVGQYGGPTAGRAVPPPYESWGRPPTEGLYRQYEGPTRSENWGRPPRGEGLGAGAPGIGRQNIQDSFIPYDHRYRRQDASFPRR